jgi:hypothetical protein
MVTLEGGRSINRGNQVEGTLRCLPPVLQNIGLQSIKFLTTIKKAFFEIIGRG